MNIKKEKVKVICIGDPHFMNTNINEMEIFTTKFHDLVNIIKPDLIVNLGDTLNNHEISNSYPAEMCRKFHKPLPKIAKVAIIIGNHDLVDNQAFLSKWHHLGAYKQWNNTIVADKVRALNIKGNKFVFVPYVYKGRFMEALNTLPDSLVDTRAIFAHQEFKGANYGGQKSSDGDIWPEENPMVISGHIHDYQKCQKNVIYTGTPLPHTFGKERRKTISVFTFNPDGSYTEDRHDLKIVKKRKITLTIDEAMEWSPPNGILIKLVIKGSIDGIQIFKKTTKYQSLKEKVVRLRLERDHIVKKSTGILFKNKQTFLGHFKSLVKDKREREIYCDIFDDNINSFKRRIIRRKIKVKRKEENKRLILIK